MDKNQRYYVAIDLKSFYASVECVERGLDPLNTNLVVADASRTEKTICLAVSPSLKAYGISGRARLFEVVSKVREVNIERAKAAGVKELTKKSTVGSELKDDASLAVDYIVAKPRMALYMDYSTKIFDIYLKYVAAEDMHVYSVDEVFIDVTAYLNTFRTTPEAFAMKMILDVYNSTGITATAGIGTNMYLAKIAMDIEAKHMPADENGVRMAFLDEKLYRKKLWNHHPITDFWRVGAGTAKKLYANGMYTMGDIARCSLGSKGDFYNEDLLYKLFGVNAELLIDHAWGWEPVLIKDITDYAPEVKSLSTGQVLHCPYDAVSCRLIVKEMTDLLVLDLVRKKMTTDQIVLTLGYDIDNLKDPKISQLYKGPVVKDHYGRLIPEHSHGTINLPEHTSSTKMIMEAVLQLYDRIVNPKLLIRRVNVAAAHTLSEDAINKKKEFVQMDLFTDYAAEEARIAAKEAEEKKEKSIQHAILNLQDKYGKNAVLKGMNLEEGAQTIARNGQIGGHKA
ncbi:MAG: DNA methylase [Pseudobutyrivibrio sp.]|nr:DNA methylase [Pseudobutyrivibrio sp.]